MSSDQRRLHSRADFPRARLRFPRGRVYEDQLLQDLSAGGVFAFTDYTLPVGSELDVEIIVAESAEPFRVIGRVVRIQIGGEPASRGMAVEFVDPDPALSAALDAIVEAYKARVESRRHGGASGPHDRQPPMAVSGPPAQLLESEIDLDPLEEGLSAQPQPELPLVSTKAEPPDGGEGFVWPIEHEEHAKPEDPAEPVKPSPSAVHAPPAAPQLDLATARVAHKHPIAAVTAEATLGPESIASQEDFVEYLVHGSRLRTTERFDRLEPVSRFDIQVSDWLKEADDLASIQRLALGRMRESELLRVLHLFFERGLVRITA